MSDGTYEGGGLTCPRCGHQGASDVLDSRPRDWGVHRRRRCQRCKRPFTTQERLSSDEGQLRAAAGRRRRAIVAARELLTALEAEGQDFPVDDADLAAWQSLGSRA